MLKNNCALFRYVSTGKVDEQNQSNEIAMEKESFQ